MTHLLGRLLALTLCAALVGTLPAAPVTMASPGTARASAPPATSSSTASTAGAPLAIAGRTDLAAQARPRRRGTTRFKIASFNILGSQHTRGSRRWAAGWRRARLTARIVRVAAPGIVGFQEVQADQLKALRRHLDGYAMWPRTSLGAGARRLQLAWRTQKFEAVRFRSLTTSFDRQRRALPVVTLRERRSGARFHVMVVHNSPRGQERSRDRATKRQLKLVNLLRRSGRPVFVVGDVNERREFFCKGARWAGLTAPNGGRSGRRGCRPPRPPIIDVVLGAGPVRWLGYRLYRGSWVRRASDHRLVLAKVEVRRRR